MADRNFPSIQVPNFQYDPVLVAGSFSATAGGITAGTLYGSGFNVVYNGVGDYTVTTTEPYRHVVSFGTGLGLTTPNADFTSTAFVPVGGAGAVVALEIACFDTATATQANPAAAADRISFWMLLSNSGTDFVR